MFSFAKDYYSRCSIEEEILVDYIFLVEDIMCVEDDDVLLFLEIPSIDLG